MDVIALDSPRGPEAVRLSVSKLFDGGIIAYPTETLYGLGAKYDNNAALARLFELKRRPRERTLPIIIGCVEQLEILANAVNETAEGLIRRFWPGPLTLVFDAKSGLNEHITCNGKIAVRIPGRSFALDLARSAGFPITATSANISGEPAAGNISMIETYFDHKLDLAVDGGEAIGSVPSTIVDVTGETAVVLREGAISASVLFMR
ncbi:MAG TPA: L-threonylcarbamoyladenylate synthase [Dissulfurispiraceae bacterium]|nr:L-threonylcarbamoyladenylate synthase [Dissulfurispiraceae bacterium]